MEVILILINSLIQDKSYSGYGIGYDFRSHFSISNFDCSKSVLIFGVDMSSSVHIENKGKNILILGKGATKALSRIFTFTVEAEYSISFTRKFCLNLHYNGSNSFLFVNATKMYQFKAKDSDIKKYPLCLGNISKDLQLISWIKILNGYVHEFSVDCNIIDTSNIIDIHKYLMKKHDIKQCLG